MKEPHLHNLPIRELIKSQVNIYVPFALDKTFNLIILFFLKKKVSRKEKLHKLYYYIKIAAKGRIRCRCIANSFRAWEAPCTLARERETGSSNLRGSAYTVATCLHYPLMRVSWLARALRHHRREWKSRSVKVREPQQATLPLLCLNNARSPAR